MTSDDEDGPPAKHIKLDTNEPIMDVRIMNKMFPKIDNLEHFPEKVLLTIFAKVDDLDLYHLAENSTRFEKIAKIELNRRYTHEYFTVDESNSVWKPIDYGTAIEKYMSFFQRFGKDIRSIEIKNVACLNHANFWILELLGEATNLKNLMLNQCRIEHHYLLQQAGVGITHLTLREVYVTQWIVVPDYRDLKKLEIWTHHRETIPMRSVAEIVRHNPKLESLVLGEDFSTYFATVAYFYPFGEVMRAIGSHLNQLKELTYVCNGQSEWDEPFDRVPNDVVDAFVRSLQHLESLTLSSSIDTHTEFFEFLRRLSSECPNIKHLKLYDVDREDDELFDIIQLFKRIESLALRFTNFSQANEMYEHIISMVEHLPNLRHLTLAFDQNCSFDWLYMPLELLRRSKSVEQLVLVSEHEDSQMEVVGTSNFHVQLIRIMPCPNTKVVVNVKDQFIGSVSKDEVLWRNKLMHWTGCSAERSLSNTNLLDLNQKPQNGARGEQPSPFELILGYLDLNSLCRFAQVNEQCSKLVEDFAKQHSQRQGTFLITDEFNRDAEYDGLEMFAEFVINLKADMFHGMAHRLRILLRNFHNLKKLHVYAESDVNAYKWIVPQVRHYTYNGPGCHGFPELYNLSCACPDLEKLTLKREMRGDLNLGVDGRFRFRRLKKFTLKYDRNIEQNLENLRILFLGSNTTLNLTIQDDNANFLD